MSYDSNNLFAKILRGEIPCRKVYEDPHVLAFYDIHPQRKVHILIIPKGNYRHFSDFTTLANPVELTAFFQAIAHIAAEHNLDQSGYRLITNQNADGGQEIPHFHMHLLGGEPVGPLTMVQS